MIWLILGVLLWSGAHLFKRLAPEARAAMGDRAKGPVALAIVASLVLMTIGVRGAPYIHVWTPPAFFVHLNNLMIWVSFYLMAIAGHRVWLDRKMRHPMLTGVKLWAVAHLMVNGDLISIILFGGILAWAVIEVILINKSGPRPPVGEPAVIRKEFTFAIATVAVFGIVAWVHLWLGYPPFGA